MVSALSEHAAAVLYDIAQGERLRWAHSISKSTNWEYNCRYGLYQLAVTIADSAVSDAEIFPVIFGEAGTALIQTVVRSEYYFWDIVCEIASYGEIGTTKSAHRAINRIRNANTRISIDLRAAMRDRMTPQQICQFTSMGIILWDANKEDWVLNPLWFAERELAKV